MAAARQKKETEKKRRIKSDKNKLTQSLQWINNIAVVEKKRANERKIAASAIAKRLEKKLEIFITLNCGHESMRWKS